MLRNYGQSKKYHHDFFAFNRRMDTIQAAILNVKLQHLDEWNMQRRKIAEIYSRCLGNLDGIIEIPRENADGEHVYHLYVIGTKNIEERDNLQNFLKEKGIDTGIHYPIPIHLQQAFSHLGYKEGDFPKTEKFTKQILSLPMFPGMKGEEVKYVANRIKSFFNLANKINIESSAICLRKNGKVLLEFRDNKPEISSSDSWSLVGGYKEKNETPIQTVERELKEETGIEARNIRFLAKLELKDFLECVDQTVHVFLGDTDKDVSEMRLTESRKVGYFSFDDAAKLKMAPYYKEFIVKNKDKIFEN